MSFGELAEPCFWLVSCLQDKVDQKIRCHPLDVSLLPRSTSTMAREDSGQPLLQRSRAHSGGICGCPRLRRQRQLTRTRLSGTEQQQQRRQIWWQRWSAPAGLAVALQ